MPTARILVLIDLFPPIVGGAETHARDLVDALRAEGRHVHVLTRQARPDLPINETLPNGARVYRVPAIAGGVRLAKYMVIPAFKRKLRELADHYDVIYLCGFRVLGWPIVKLAHRLGKPIVLRAEVCGELSGTFIWQQPDQPPSALLRALFRPLIRQRNRRLLRADLFLAISGVIHSEYAACGVPEAKIADIPNGIDTRRFEPPADAAKVSALRQALNLPADEIIFAYSGKLNRGKGLDRLLDAWARWVRESRQGHLVLIGSGGGQFLSIESRLKQRVRDGGLAERVTLSGYRQDVERWLQAADIFVFPSESESFGLAPLEANACGLPVVATDAGALAETVPDGLAGLSIPVGDADALYKAMRQLATDDALRHELGRRALARVHGTYAFPVVARQHGALFDKLITSERAEA